MDLEGTSIGNYLIKSKLGEGGMGAVYLGEHPLIGKKVAVKVLREGLGSNADVVRRFFNEAKAVNDIRHQNIVDIVDFGKMPSPTGDIAYIIMEFLEGESLNSRLRSVGLRTPEVVDVMSQCCSALAASHAKGIVHRDLKPDNIYLCPRGPTRNFVKVLDFGIAKLSTNDPEQGQTRTGTVMGTPYYMSPEQCEGRRQIDHRADIYSLGVVMYELLTGRVPFPGEGFGAIIVAHLTYPVPPMSSVRPGVPPELEAVVMRAMEKDPNNRFQTMDEFAQALGDPAWFGALQPVRASAQMATVMGASGIRNSRPPAIGSQSGIRPVTTLSGSASEISQPIPLQRASGSRAGLFAVLGLLVLGGGGGAFWYLKGGMGGSAPQPAAAIPAAPAKAKIKLTFTTLPSGAKIVKPDGTVIGKTPMTMEVDKEAADFDVAFVLEGYNQQRRRVVADDDKELLVTLQPKDAPAPAPVVAAPSHSHHSSHHSSSSSSSSSGDSGGSGSGDDARLLRSSLLDDPAPKH